MIDGRIKAWLPKIISQVFVFGKVTNTDGLYVQLESEDESDSVPLARLDSYTPALNDRVIMLRTGKTLLVLGKVTL